MLRSYYQITNYEQNILRKSVILYLHMSQKEKLCTWAKRKTSAKEISLYTSGFTFFFHFLKNETKCEVH